MSGIRYQVRSSALRAEPQRASSSSEKRGRTDLVPYSRAGFTIIEVLVALAILLFGMTAVLGMLTFGAALTRTALLRTSAASASHAVVADLEETLFPMVGGLQEAEAGVGEAGPPVEVKERSLPGMPDLVYSAHARENPKRPLEYRVDVEMSWKSAGVRREMSFSTLLVREIPFGERLRQRFVENKGAPPPPSIPVGR